MPAGPSHFEQFSRAVHRRMVLLRGLERLGLCLLAGSVALLILMPILIWRGQGTWELLVATTGLSLLAGIVSAYIARPSKLAAVAEADRQLGLSDLLGTALALRGRALSDEFERTVLALAEAQCQQASPSAVVLNRFGPRGWGGIGLAGALVVGLSLMGGESTKSQARAETPRTWQEIEAQRERETGNSFHTPTPPDMRTAPQGTGGDDDQKDPLQSAVPDPAPQGGTEAEKRSADNRAGNGQEGNGAGSAQSALRSGSSGAVTPVTAGAGVKSNTPGAASGGGGDASSEAGKNGQGGGSVASSAANKARRPAPVWHGPEWSTAQDQAGAAIRNGRVPDAYRDLVRAYFERE